MILQNISEILTTESKGKYWIYFILLLNMKFHYLKYSHSFSNLSMCVYKCTLFQVEFQHFQRIFYGVDKLIVHLYMQK